MIRCFDILTGCNSSFDPD